MRKSWLLLALISAALLFAPASADEEKPEGVLRNEAGHRLLIGANNLHKINKFLIYLINYKSLEDRISFVHDKKRLRQQGITYETYYSNQHGEFRRAGFHDVFHFARKTDCSEDKIERYYKDHLSSDYISGLSVSGELKLEFTKTYHKPHLETLDDSGLAIKKYPEKMKANIYQFGCEAHVNQRSIYSFLSDLILTCNCFIKGDFDKLHRSAYLEKGVISGDPFLRNALSYYVLSHGIVRHSIADKNPIFIFDHGTFDGMHQTDFFDIEDQHITISSRN